MSRDEQFSLHLKRSSFGGRAATLLRSRTPASIAISIVERAERHTRMSRGHSTYEPSKNAASKEVEMYEEQAAAGDIRLEALSLGDRDAVSELYKEHYPKIARFFQSKVGGATREDLIQQTFLACLRGEGIRVRGQTRFAVYLFGIARNVLAEHLRRLSRHKARLGTEMDIDETPIESLEQSPSATVAQHEEQRLILEALRRIPLIHQLALELHYWDDLTTFEIADVLGVPVGTVKTRLRDGRTYLREQLEKLARASEAPQDAVSDLDGEPDDLARWARRVRAQVPPRAGTDVSAPDLPVTEGTGDWRTAR